MQEQWCHEEWGRGVSIYSNHIMFILFIVDIFSYDSRYLDTINQLESPCSWRCWCVSLWAAVWTVSNHEMLILNLNISTKSQPVKVDREWREGDGPSRAAKPRRNNHIDIATNITYLSKLIVEYLWGTGKIVDNYSRPPVDIFTDQKCWWWQV